MTVTSSLAPILERFFTQRLMTQRRVSPNTVASYRDTFCQLLQFAQRQVEKTPATLALPDINASLIGAFLDDLEKSRGLSARSRNLRLTAIRSFFRYAAYYEPAHAGQIQQVLAIPCKRQDRPLVGLSEPHGSRSNTCRPRLEELARAPGSCLFVSGISDRPAFV